MHWYRSWAVPCLAPRGKAMARPHASVRGAPTLEAWKRAASTATELSTAPAPTNVRPRPKLFRAVSRAEVHLPSRRFSRCQDSSLA